MFCFIGGGNLNYDVKTQSGLTNLYNQKVVAVEKVTRPLGSGVSVGKIRHDGIRYITCICILNYDYCRPYYYYASYSALYSI